MEPKKNLRKRAVDFFCVKAPAKWEYLLAALICAMAFFLFAHPDIIETANHSWLLLDNIFKGNFMGFYEDVYAHQNSFYYINAAHYNICVYLLFAIWELPIYIFCTVFTISINETFLYLWAKALACGFIIACGYLTFVIAKRMGVQDGVAKYAGLGVIMSPITLLSVFSMGQYDGFCLFFILLATVFYFDKKYFAFCLVMGAAIVCKFFAIFLLLPMLLLCEKRITRLVVYLATSMWLYLPTTLLFHGRSADAGFFNSLMTERLLSAEITFGAVKVPIFILAFSILLAFCFLYSRGAEKENMRFTVYICLVAYSALFLFMGWHPQWLVLLVPFMVLTTAVAENKVPYYILDIILSGGYLLLIYLNFPKQLESNMLDFGLIGAISGLKISGLDYNGLAFYFGLIPYAFEIAGALFVGGILAGIIFKAPLGGGCFSDRLGKNGVHSPAARVGLWAPTLCVFGGLFVAPCAFEWLKGFNII